MCYRLDCAKDILSNYMKIKKNTNILTEIKLPTKEKELNLIKENNQEMENVEGKAMTDWCFSLFSCKPDKTSIITRADVLNYISENPSQTSMPCKYNYYSFI